MIAEQLKVKSGGADISTVLEELDVNWNADERPLFAQGGIDSAGNVLSDVSIDSHKALVRSDNQHPLGIVGSRYEPVQNTTAFAFLDAIILDEKATYENIWLIDGGARMIVQAKVSDASFDIRPGDALEGYITMINSFNGTTPFKVFFTTIRMWCQNQLNAAIKNMMVNISLRHTKSVLDNVEDSLRVFGKSQEYFKHFQETATMLANKQMDAKMVDAFLADVMGEAESTRKENQHKVVTDLAENGMGNNGQTLWDWYNGVTEYVDHHSNKNEGKRMASALVGHGFNLKQKAWDTATAMLNM
jgi:phage/plasmid-like protein (TIGR03299 family)